MEPPAVVVLVVEVWIHLRSRRRQRLWHRDRRSHFSLVLLIVALLLQVLSGHFLAAASAFVLACYSHLQLMAPSGRHSSHPFGQFRTMARALRVLINGTPVLAYGTKETGCILPAHDD